MRFSAFHVIFFLVLGGLILGVISVFSDEDSAIHYLTGTGGRAHYLGAFETNYGNAGVVSFDETISNVSFQKANLYGTGLSGFFWTETSGWAEFTGAYIGPKYSGSGVRETWYASGYAWSEYAGWFTLTGTEYYPDTTTLSGWLWSDSLGWIAVNAFVDDIGAGFIGRVKVVGNMVGEDIYNTLYSPGNEFDASIVSTRLNAIRKNIALNTRNADAYISTNFSSTTPTILNEAVYYNNTGNTEPFVRYSDIMAYFSNSSTGRTLAVIGGDVYIDTGIILSASSPPHGIIALKNDLGKGGNIYINGKVTRIDASLVVDKSIYSGRWTGSAWDLYNANKIRTTALPNYQLYIRGSILSRNTIGGAGLTTTSYCPFTDTTSCTFDDALRYDFNYFRDFQTGAVYPPSDIPLHRGYPSDVNDMYSLVIEYDPRVLTDPPPSF